MKVGIWIAAILAWGATIFTYKLPELGIAHASPEEAQPFVYGFAGLALMLTLLAFKKSS